VTKGADRFTPVIDGFEAGLAPDGRAVDVVGAAGRALAEAVPSDVWCGVLLDPSTLLDTGGEHEHGFPSEAMPRLFEIEHVEQDDVDNLRALVRRRSDVSLLSTSARGDLDGSKYYREILRPIGLADELRVLLRDGAGVWGLLVFCRDTDSRPFSPDDLDLAARLGASAGRALRRSLLLAGVDRGDVPDAPGLLTLDADLGVHSMSATAELLVSLIQESGPARPYPYAVQALAVRSRGAAPGSVVRSRIPIAGGRWLALHAWTIDGPLTIVSVAAAEPGELAAVILDVYGLTPREREVAQQVLLGRSTVEAARALGLSPFTVQDHLKSVYRKTGVQSRQEFTASLFFSQYLPRLSAPTLSTDGRLLADGA
jgi:DNA-binding CsgD family transcriptional regulator